MRRYILYFLFLMQIIFVSPVYCGDFPTIGGDRNVWGQKLKDFLGFSLVTDSGANSGKLKILGNYVDVSQYASLNSASASAGVGPAILMISKPTAITANYTQPSNITLWVTPGNYISVPSSYTHTVQGSIQAGDYPIWVGTGTVVFDKGFKGGINGAWFGIVQDWNGTTGTDNSTALQRWFSSVPVGGVAVLPLAINKGVSYSSSLTLPPHNNVILFGNNVLKYTGNGVAINSRGDKTSLYDLFLIGNASATAGIHFTNNNSSLFQRIYVMGTGGIAFDLEGGPLGSLFLHCGVDHNGIGVINNDVLNSATWGGDPTVGFRMREHIPSGQEPNVVTFINCNVTLSTGNTTSKGWDIDCGGRISLIGCILQWMDIGVHVYDGGYATGYKPNRIALHDVHFESGTFNTAPIVDAFAGDNSVYGICEEYLGAINLCRKNFAGLYSLVSGNIPGLYFYNDTATHAQGQGLRGDAKNGVGVLGILTNPTGGVAASEDWGGVVGRVIGTTGVGVRGRGGNSATTYSGFFEEGMFYTTTFNPKYITVADNTNLGAANDFACYVNASGKTITLPAASSSSGQIILVKLVAIGTCTVNASAGSIDGAGTYSLTAQYKYVLVQSDSTNWNIIGSN